MDNKHALIICDADEEILSKQDRWGTNEKGLIKYHISQTQTNRYISICKALLNQSHFVNYLF